jgi:hypothetical protein
MEMATAEVTNQAERIDDGSCFVCHGTGHWAREVLHYARSFHL